MDGPLDKPAIARVEPADVDFARLSELWSRALDGLGPLLDPSHRELANHVQAIALMLPTEAEAEEEDPFNSGVKLLSYLADADLLAHAVPASFGGVSEPLDVRSLCLIRERLAAISGLADAMFALQGLGSYPVAIAGSDVLRLELLPGVATGTIIPAFAMTEEDAGSDAGAIATTARRDGDDYVLDGKKVFISNAGIADFYTVFARTGGTGAKGISAFVVRADDPGVEVPLGTPIVAPHPVGSIVFDGCRVPAGRRLGEEGEGIRIALRTLDVFRATVGAAALGFAGRALAESIARTTTREQFGNPLSSFQGVQWTLADMACELDAARLLVYRAGWVRDNGATRITRESAMGKYMATEAAQRIVDACVQLHGGLGVTRGSIPERLYREVRALRIYEGTSEVQRLVIARELLKEDK